MKMTNITITKENLTDNLSFILEKIKRDGKIELSINEDKDKFKLKKGIEKKWTNDEIGGILNNKADVDDFFNKI